MTSTLHVLLKSNLDTGLKNLQHNKTILTDNVGHFLLTDVENLNKSTIGQFEQIFYYKSDLLDPVSNIKRFLNRMKYTHTFVFDSNFTY